jgi:hypothetical protein
MHEPGWISFYSGALEIEERVGVGQADARKRLRAACREEMIISMKAPCDEPAGQLPFEFWKRVAPREWRKRDVDYDGPDADGCEIEVMLKEDDFRRWLDRLDKPASKPTRASRRQYLAKQAIDALQLPDNLPNSELEKRVGDWLKAKHQLSVSRTTILRAAGRRR